MLVTIAIILLGKMHIRIIPGLPFNFLYFELNKHSNIL